jgi:hypothetical protein
MRFCGRRLGLILLRFRAGRVWRISGDGPFTKVPCIRVLRRDSVLTRGVALDRKKAISILIVLALFAGAVAAVVLAPKRNMVGQHLSQAAVFWNDNDAFLFVNVNTTGRSRSYFQEKLAQTRYGYLNVLTGGFADFSRPSTVAFHLASSGQLERFALPDNTASFGSWGLADGELQMTPPPSTLRRFTGFRWDGQKFIPVPAAPAKPEPIAQAQTGNSRLTPDDLAGDDDADDSDGFLSKPARQAFHDAGWHYKVLTGFETAAGTEATLPITLGESTFDLTIQTFPPNPDLVAHLDFLSVGVRSLQLSGNKLASAPQVLWNQQGWRAVSKEEYQQLRAQYGRPTRALPVSTWVWLAVALVCFLWRFGGFFHTLWIFGTMKQRVLNNMATSYSFPPVTTAQFPLLDLAELDRYTRAFEAMGFTRLLDFSLVSDSKVNPPSFCRLFAHTRHHCFGEVSQIFPKGKAPMPVKCSINCCLQNGWTISFSDRKPQATSSLIRRRRAIGVCMPETNPSELLQAFLKMRDQVCLDLVIQPINDDTLEAYTAKVQRQVKEMREAVQDKNFVKGLPEAYLRKFSLLKTKPEYVWLGDYPKEAEQRKQGFNSFAAGAQ